MGSATRMDFAEMLRACRDGERHGATLRAAVFGPLQRPSARQFPAVARVWPNVAPRLFASIVVVSNRTQSEANRGDRAKRGGRAADAELS